LRRPRVRPSLQPARRRGGPPLARRPADFSDHPIGYEEVGSSAIAGLGLEGSGFGIPGL